MTLSAGLVRSLHVGSRPEGGLLATRPPITVDARRAHVESAPVATAWSCLCAVRDGDLRFALEFTRGVTREQLAELRRRLPDTDAWGVTSTARPLAPGEEEVVLIADVDERYPADELFVTERLYVVDEPDPPGDAVRVRVRHTGTGPRVVAII